MASQNLLNINVQLQHIDETLTNIQNLADGMSRAGQQSEKTTSNVDKFKIVLGGAAWAAKELAETMVETTVKMDRMNAMMQASSGSAQLAAANLQFVKETSKALGTDMLTSADAFAKLTAATKGTALEGEQTQKIFEAVSRANAALGGSTGDLTGMLQALSQMVSKGTVSMEELRGQLGERLPGAMKMAADAMGMTTDALIEQISKGNVLAEDMLPKLAQAIDEAYKNARFDNAQNNINRLSNAWTEFKQNIVSSDWVNAAINNITRVTEMMARNTSATLENQIAHAKARISTFKEEGIIGAGLRAMGDYSGFDINKEINNLARLEQQLEKQKKAIADSSKPATPAMPAYVTQTDKFLLDHETNKLVKIRKSREEELKFEEQAYKRALDLAKDNAQQQTAIKEAHEKRKLAITQDYAKKEADEQAKQNRPGEQAAKRAQREAEKIERERQSMIERSRDLIAGYENDIMSFRARTLTDSLKKIDELAEKQIQSERDKYINAKLWGEQAKQAYEEFGKVEVAIKAKAVADKEELVRKSTNRLIDYENELTRETARLNNDRLTELKAVHEAELKEIKDRYDREVEEAKRAGREIGNVTKLYEERVLATNKKYTEDRLRINGGYWEKLSFKIKDSYGESGNFVDDFNSKMVDMTVSTTDSMANAFVDMAASGKATWKDFAYSVIIEIEKMIAKMLILWGVQQLVGLAGGMIGGETGGLMAKSAGQSPFNGSGMFTSFGNANGNAFDQGEVVPFANGGVFDNSVVNKPTLFPMANKRTGLLGEAGPEAIMPLARDSNGRLGIRSLTNNQTSTTSTGINIGAIQVHVSGNTNNPQQTGQQIGSAIERQLRQLIQKEVKDAYRPGNSLNPSRTIGGAVPA